MIQVVGHCIFSIPEPALPGQNLDVNDSCYSQAHPPDKAEPATTMSRRMYDENGKPQNVNFSPSEVNEKTLAGAWLPSIQGAFFFSRRRQRHQEQLQGVFQNANYNLASDLSPKS